VAFILSGFVKAVDPLGTQYKIHDYLVAWGLADVVPDFLTLSVSVVQSSAEFFLGICLLFAIRRRLVSLISMILMVVMTLLTLWLAIANPISDCGCFGDALVLTNWQTFWKNVVLLSLVVVLLCTKKHIPQTFVARAELCIVLIGLALAGGLMLYTHYHLPLIDFRPYKIGNNIPELMEIPEGAPHDEYAVTLIYEKDGVEQEFTLQDYPKGDSTWRFVDQRSKLVSKGYEPPIHDFELVDYDGEDLTYDILDMDKVVLTVMYDLDKADLSQIGKVVDLCQACEEQAVPFFILTSATDEQIYEFIADHIEPILDNTRGLIEVSQDAEAMAELHDELLNHWRMLFLNADGIMLKTIVRANPGVFVVEKGIITDKYNIRNR
jgi:hypothetical protein